MSKPTSQLQQLAISTLHNTRNDSSATHITNALTQINPRYNAVEFRIFLEALLENVQGEWSIVLPVIVTAIVEVKYLAKEVCDVLAVMCERNNDMCVYTREMREKMDVERKERDESEKNKVRKGKGKIVEENVFVFEESITISKDKNTENEQNPGMKDNKETSNTDTKLDTRILEDEQNNYVKDNKETNNTDTKLDTRITEDEQNKVLHFSKKTSNIDKNVDTEITDNEINNDMNLSKKANNFCEKAHTKTTDNNNTENMYDKNNINNHKFANQENIEQTKDVINNKNQFLQGSNCFKENNIEQTDKANKESINFFIYSSLKKVYNKQDSPLLLVTLSILVNLSTYYKENMIQTDCLLLANSLIVKSADKEINLKFYTLFSNVLLKNHNFTNFIICISKICMFNRKVKLDKTLLHRIGRICLYKQEESVVGGDWKPALHLLLSCHKREETLNYNFDFSYYDKVEVLIRRNEEFKNRIYDMKKDNILGERDIFDKFCDVILEEKKENIIETENYSLNFDDKNIDNTNFNADKNNQSSQCMNLNQIKKLNDDEYNESVDVKFIAFLNINNFIYELKNNTIILIKHEDRNLTTRLYEIRLKMMNKQKKNKKLEPENVVIIKKEEPIKKKVQKPVSIKKIIKKRNDYFREHYNLFRIYAKLLNNYELNEKEDFFKVRDDQRNSVINKIINEDKLKKEIIKNLQNEIEQGIILLTEHLKNIEQTRIIEGRNQIEQENSPVSWTRGVNINNEVSNCNENGNNNWDRATAFAKNDYSNVNSNYVPPCVREREENININKGKLFGRNDNNIGFTNALIKNTNNENKLTNNDSDNYFVRGSKKVNTNNCNKEFVTDSNEIVGKNIEFTKKLNDESNNTFIRANKKIESSLYENKIINSEFNTSNKKIESKASPIIFARETKKIIINETHYKSEGLKINKMHENIVFDKNVIINSKKEINEKTEFIRGIKKAPINNFQKENHIKSNNFYAQDSRDEKFGNKNESNTNLYNGRIKNRDNFYSTKKLEIDTNNSRFNNRDIISDTKRVERNNKNDNNRKNDNNTYSKNETDINSNATDTRKANNIINTKLNNFKNETENNNSKIMHKNANEPIRNAEWNFGFKKSPVLEKSEEISDKQKQKK